MNPTPELKTVAGFTLLHDENDFARFRAENNEFFAYKDAVMYPVFAKTYPDGKQDLYRFIHFINPLEVLELFSALPIATLQDLKDGVLGELPDAVRMAVPIGDIIAAATPAPAVADDPEPEKRPLRFRLESDGTLEGTRLVDIESGRAAEFLCGANVVLSGDDDTYLKAAVWLELSDVDIRGVAAPDCEKTTGFNPVAFVLKGDPLPELDGLMTCFDATVSGIERDADGNEREPVLLAPPFSVPPIRFEWAVPGNTLMSGAEPTPGEPPLPPAASVQYSEPERVFGSAIYDGERRLVPAREKRLPWSKQVQMVWGTTLATDNAPVPLPMIRCFCGNIIDLSAGVVAPNGDVDPELVCSGEKGCGFRALVRLEGWPNETLAPAPLAPPPPVGDMKMTVETGAVLPLAWQGERVAVLKRDPTRNWFEQSGPRWSRETAPDPETGHRKFLFRCNCGEMISFSDYRINPDGKVYPAYHGAKDFAEFVHSGKGGCYWHGHIQLDGWETDPDGWPYEKPFHDAAKNAVVGMLLAGGCKRVA